MFCLCSLNKSLNHIHERGQRLIYDAQAHSFHNILEMTIEKTMHKKSLECLAKEIYKFLHGISPPIMNNLLEVRVNHL